MVRWDGIPEQIEDRRRRAYRARYSVDADPLANQSGSRNHVRHADVLVVHEQRMRNVVRMLTERFTMVTQDDEQRALVNMPYTEAVEKQAQRRVFVMQGVEIAVEIARALEGTDVIRRRIRMMSRDGQIGQEEPFAAAQRIDPGEHAAHCRRLIDAKTRAHQTTD